MKALEKFMFGLNCGNGITDVSSYIAEVIFTSDKTVQVELKKIITINSKDK